MAVDKKNPSVNLGSVTAPVFFYINTSINCHAKFLIIS